MIPPITLVTPSGFLVTGGGAVTEVPVVPEVVDPVGADVLDPVVPEVVDPVGADVLEYVLEYVVEGVTNDDVFLFDGCEIGINFSNFFK
tara:strand:+ start:259 stop:525 length:267 start_codon:yes stop_codon:yes gene_type:complete